MKNILNFSRYSIVLFSVLIVTLSQQALAASTSGIPGPVVNPDDRSLLYRFAYSPSEDDDDVPREIRHRIHYQHSLNADFRVRAISQLRDNGNDMKFDYVGAELLWHFKKRNADEWDSAFRFGFRNSRGGRQTYGLDWANQWKLDNNWQARAALLFGWQSGNNANSGTRVSTRFSALYKMQNSHKIGVEMFNSYGRFGDTGSFDNQSHQIGPVLSGKINGYNYQLSYLNGVSDSASEHDFRIWIGKSF